MELKLIALQPSTIVSSQKAIEPRPTDIAFLIVINLTIFSTIAAVIYAYFSKRRQHLLLSVKSHPTSLCQRCKYFSNNPYLKCALHPVTVMTEEASDCKNYSPHVEGKRFNN